MTTEVLLDALRAAAAAGDAEAQWMLQIVCRTSLGVL